MSISAQKRRSSSSSLDDHHRHNHKRKKASPQPFSDDKSSRITRPIPEESTLDTFKNVVMGVIGRINPFADAKDQSQSGQARHPQQPAQSASRPAGSKRIADTSTSAGGAVTPADDQLDDVQKFLLSKSGSSLQMLAEADSAKYKEEYEPIAPKGSEEGSEEHPLDFTEDDGVKMAQIHEPNGSISGRTDGLLASSEAGPSHKPLINSIDDRLFQERFSVNAENTNSLFESGQPPTSQLSLSEETKQNSKGASFRPKSPTKPSNSHNQLTQPQPGYDFRLADGSPYHHIPASHPALRRPHRPEVSITPPRKAKKGWEADKRSTSSSESSSSRESSENRSQRRKNRSNMRSPKKSKEIGESMVRRICKQMAAQEEAQGKEQNSRAILRVQNLFSGKGAGIGNQIEKAHMAISHIGINADKQFLQSMLLANRRVTLEERTQPKANTFDVNGKRATGKQARERADEQAKIFNVKSVLKSLEELDAEQKKKDAEIEASLRPKAPTKFSEDRERQIVAYLKDPAFKARVALAQCEASSIRRLKDGTWLDDEIMNFYGALMVERAKSTSRKVHFFNSFFYQRVGETGYSAVKRWTKKVDIFSMNTVIFPINIGNMHWTACAINFDQKRIEYYDSMGDGGRHRDDVFELVRSYLDDEHKERKGKPFNFNGWSDEFNKNSPQQNNGSDCGVFSCQTLEMISRGRDLKKDGFEFKAEHMPYFRRLMIWEIAHGKLEERSWGNPKF
ncbi:uncharacterized protein I303_100480 [Kwoniella dejecticola CBS 10117]|uniref:Ubiquitin-like protease family profile domain-containing protein n=1 Tax=Kwoniella dejecticola CBS 10117 TaxID=1296121 RepID=A0A1A6AF58_9TREE|nr:uncharacterized protein I303_00480 [Kwoniella dejecticola CBS 10117]OBR88663.1 hypothetical protein I303_00480 [Kwoniella dejecticola CBS 10117]